MTAIAAVAEPARISGLCTDPMCGDDVQCYLAYNTEQQAAGFDTNELLLNPMPETSSGQPLSSG